MCSNSCNGLGSQGLIAPIKDEENKCKKCPSSQVFVLLQKEHSFCRECFHDYCCHKFRSTIGKTHLVNNHHKVLVAVSGGYSSLVMVHMIEEGLSLQNRHRRLQFTPYFLFVDESIVLDEDSVVRMSSYLKQRKHDSFLVRLEQAFRSSDENFVVKISSQTEDTSRDEQEATHLKSVMSKLTSDTSRDDFIRRIRNQLIVDAATKLGCNYIFLGSCGSRLAVQMITDTAQGRGSSLHDEIGFLDSRTAVPILKPMREFTGKEIAYYARLKYVHPLNVTAILTKCSLKSSVWKVTESFINHLEQEFPATTYSLCRISTKVKSRNMNQDVRCILCQTPSDRIAEGEEEEACSAMAAFHVSRNLCQENDERSCSAREKKRHLVPPSLCYSCCQIISESEDVAGELVHLHHVRNRVVGRKEINCDEGDTGNESQQDKMQQDLRSAISDFLLE